MPKTKFRPDRYDTMTYRRCGRSGLDLPLVSLGLWHNFGAGSPLSSAQALCRRAFDLGITHFDLANNYGPPPGAAEQTLGKILTRDFKSHRDELIISTKAGYNMWPGPYGDYGSRKYLVASIDQSLERMGLDYVDIFYHHRPDPKTPLEETMGALDYIVKSGRALYAGISNYGPKETARAHAILHKMGTPVLINQVIYNMLNYHLDDKGFFPVLRKKGIGCIVFSPLAQGILTGKYLDGIPGNSRAASSSPFLGEKQLKPQILEKVRRFNEIAQQRGQSMVALALSWAARREEVSSVLIGARTVQQLEECAAVTEAPPLTKEECRLIRDIQK